MLETEGDLILCRWQAILIFVVYIECITTIHKYMRAPALFCRSDKYIILYVFLFLLLASMFVNQLGRVWVFICFASCQINNNSVDRPCIGTDILMLACLWHKTYTRLTCFPYIQNFDDLPRKVNET